MKMSTISFYLQHLRFKTSAHKQCNFHIIIMYKIQIYISVFVENFEKTLNKKYTMQVCWNLIINEMWYNN